MIVVEGIPHRLDEPSTYDHPQYGEITSMWFRLLHPDLPKPKEGAYEETLEASNGTIETIQAAAAKGNVIKLKCRIDSRISKAGKAWSKLQVVEVLS